MEEFINIVQETSIEFIIEYSSTILYKKNNIT